MYSTTAVEGTAASRPSRPSPAGRRVMPARPERGWVSRCFYSEIRQQPVVGCRLAGVGQVAGQRNAYSWHGIPGKMAAALHTLKDADGSILRSLAPAEAGSSCSMITATGMTTWSGK